MSSQKAVFFRAVRTSGVASYLLKFSLVSVYSEPQVKTGTAILETFYQAAGQFVRVDDLGRRLKLPATAVNAEIAELEKIGYTIESHPHFGYRLLGTPDRLTADDIKAQLKAPLIGSEILV